MANEDRFQLFGDRSRFAIELSLAPEQPSQGVPQDSLGSWGAWRIWVADVNLCRLQLDTAGGPVEVQEVRWYLAPLLRWLVPVWTPLLHETHLPEETWGDGRPRWARLAYLAMLERAGDDLDRFLPWQQWASRHALRSAGEGGLVPDVFFQRVGDEIELTWGDRIQTGGEAATFLVEEGVARASVDDVAGALSDAVSWMLTQVSIRNTNWVHTLAQRWEDILGARLGSEPLHWYLDSQPEAGRLSQLFLDGLKAIRKSPPALTGPWLGALSPEIAMFGDLAPKISPEAAVTLLTEYYRAQTGEDEPQDLQKASSDEPAWTTTSPWENGYGLARDVLDDLDPDAEAPSTDLEAILDSLSITVRDVSLGEEGPRGVALAGGGLRPTILVNTDHRMNHGYGRRFTEAHELCHILFDRKAAKPLAHSSTPWAPPSIEQRANAFAAMLLMPPSRARRPNAKSLSSLARSVSILADKLGVSRIALRRHLANLGEIDAYEREHMSLKT